MGMQFRKRTSGKNSWLNFSGSGVSSSTKVGNVTTNVGPRGRRVTVNLGNGLRYVKTSSRKSNRSIITASANAMWTLSIFIIVAYYIKEWFNL